MENRRVIGAAVSAPNTPESDAQEFVLHDVEVESGGKPFVIRIMARDPADAIDAAHKFSEDTFNGFFRHPSKR